MKSPKLKQTILCQFLLYAPVLLLFILGFSALTINEVVGVIALVLSFILALVYLFHFFPLLLTSDMLFCMIRYWKKDRLWFMVDFGESDFVASLLKQMDRHGILYEEYRTTQQKPLCVRYKRSRSPSSFWSAVERIVIAYRVDHLDEITYRQIMESAKQVNTQTNVKNKPYLFQTKEEKEAPVCRAVAVIILADRIEQSIPELARKTPNFNEVALLPCVVDLFTRRCYFDGMKDPYLLGMSGKPAKNYAVELVVKTVFQGRLPLKNNTQMDYTKIDKDELEKSLSALFKEYRQSIKEEKAISDRTARTMQDGEIRQTEDAVYIKHGEQVAIFPFITDGEPPLTTILTNEFWSLPKRQKIPKKDMATLKAHIRNYFHEQQKPISFSDEE